MGAHFSIHVDDVSVFHGYEWWDINPDRPCPHTECPHNATSSMAWGPTVATYQALECDLCGCRAWEDGRYEQEREAQSGLHGFWYHRIVWCAPPPGVEATPFFGAS